MNTACCWPYLIFKQRVTQFIPKVESKLAFNKKSLQNGMIGSLLVNQILIYCFVILTYVIPTEYRVIKEIALLAFLGYLWLFEGVILLML